jgi:NTE family protein
MTPSISSTKLIAVHAATVSGLLVMTGCLDPVCPNKRLVEFNPKVGYRFDLLDPGDNNTDSVFICISFSGGGTRAAALAYGVLLELRETLILSPSDGCCARLLDEVDIISSVSGGSFTAMAYGLWHDRLFDCRFENRFLKHNVQLDLILSLLNPKYLLRVPSILLDRSDIAAFYYDKEIFKGSTYENLVEQDRRPFVVVNATDIARRQRFEFTQDDFDLLGSDLRPLPVGWAVAASSAVPLVLSPLRLEYFPGEPMTLAIDNVRRESTGPIDSRRERWANSLLTLTDTDGTRDFPIDKKNHRFLFLLDGGLADNLGLTYFIDAYRHGVLRRKIEAGEIDKLVVIVVDAGTDRPTDLESRAFAPSVFKIGERVVTGSIRNHSAVLSGIVRYALQEAGPRISEGYTKCRDAMRDNCPDATPPPLPNEQRIETYVVEVNFSKVKDERLRRTFLSTITSFFLPAQEVEALIEAGRDILRNDPQYQKLLRDLKDNPPRPADDIT